MFARTSLHATLFYYHMPCYTSLLSHIPMLHSHAFPCLYYSPVFPWIHATLFCLIVSMLHYSAWLYPCYTILIVSMLHFLVVRILVTLLCPAHAAVPCYTQPGSPELLGSPQQQPLMRLVLGEPLQLDAPSTVLSPAPFPGQESSETKALSQQSQACRTLVW